MLVIYFFSGLINYFSVTMVWEGKGIILTGRKLTGRYQQTDDLFDSNFLQKNTDLTRNYSWRLRIQVDHNIIIAWILMKSNFEFLYCAACIEWLTNLQEH